MSLLRTFGWGKHRADEETLRERVTSLQTALNHWKGTAKRWTAVALLFLALSVVLGLYREPILQTAGDLAANLGISRSAPDADAADVAYQKGHFAAALTLARPLAEAGDAKAQSILALLYYGGRGVSQDYQEAVKWFRRAAEHGDAVAQFYLGIMFAKGQGVPQDYAEAARWYRLAADRGNADAQFNLGFAYATGEGVSLDNVSAHMWFNLAAAAFPVSDSRDRIDAANKREEMAGKMTPEQIAEAQRLAREWKPQ